MSEGLEPVEDPIGDLELRVRALLVAEAQEVLRLMVQALGDRQTTYVLGLIEAAAGRYREAIGDVSGGLVERRRPEAVWSVSPTLGGPPPAGSPIETFGAQALAQLLAVTQIQADKQEIPRLVAALADAKRAKMPEVVARLERKLNLLLDGPGAETGEAL